MIKSKYSSIIVTGSIAYDTIMDFPSLFVDYLQPDKLHQISVSFIVDKLEKQIGGTATNIAYNMSLISDRKIKILGGVGKDGNLILRFLKKRNIDIGGIILDKRLYSSSGSVITDKNDNQIWGYYYGAGKRGIDINLRDHADRNSVLVLTPTDRESFLHMQKQAIKLKSDYLYDPGMMLTSIDKSDLEEGINHCRWLVANDYEISLILKILKTTSSMLYKNISVITTLGADGVCYRDSTNHYHVSAYQSAKVIDPTGAGDAWRAGFIASIIEEKSIIKSLKIGNALASFAIERFGTANHKPTKKQIIGRVNNLNLFKKTCNMT